MRFGAARDDDLRAAGTDAVGGHGDGLQSRGAEAIDGDAGHRIGQARAQSGDARHVHAGFGFGHRAAENHVVDFFRRDGRIFFKQTPDDDGRQIVGPGVAQAALGRFADRRSQTIENYCFHDI